MDQAASVMIAFPDSAKAILEKVDTASLHNGEERARYALLLSMAIDKTGTDLTTLDILQPAIDYYFQHGTPDEQFQTYYYEGRIHQNAEDNDKAMQAFLHAEALQSQIHDSVFLGQLLVAEAITQRVQYNWEYVKQNHLKAANIYKRLGQTDRVAKSLGVALNVTVLHEDKKASDSILILIKALDLTPEVYHEMVFPEEMEYHKIFGNKKKVKEFLDTLTTRDSIPDWQKIDMTYAYLDLGLVKEAKNLFNNITPGTTTKDSLMYIAAESYIYETEQDYAKALDKYQDFTDMLADYHASELQKNLDVAKRQFNLEISNLQKLTRQKQRNTLVLAASSLLLVLLILVWTKYRSIKIQKRLEKENLLLKIAELVQGKEILQEVIDSHPKMAPNEMKAIRQRIHLLNEVLVMGLAQDSPEKFKNWRNKLHKNQKEFIDTTRLVIRGCYPGFIEYLEEADLNDHQIDVVCLYAIGMSGKLISVYLDASRHYDESMAIRELLGIRGGSIKTFIRQKLQEFAL